MSKLLREIKKLKNPIYIKGVKKKKDGELIDVSTTITTTDEGKELEEGFLSSITTAASLGKTLQISKRVERKVRTTPFQTMPSLRDDHTNLPDVLQKLDRNLHILNENIENQLKQAKEDAINLAKLISINTFATRLFLNPTKGKKK